VATIIKTSSDKAGITSIPFIPKTKTKGMDKSEYRILGATSPQTSSGTGKISSGVKIIPFAELVEYQFTICDAASVPELPSH